MFIKTVNHLYIGILKKGSFVSQKEVRVTKENGEVVHAHFIFKKLCKYTEPEREKIALDDSSKLIIFDFLGLDKSMRGNTSTIRQIYA